VTDFSQRNVVLRAVPDGNDTCNGDTRFDVLKFLAFVDINIDNEGGNFIGRVDNIEAIDPRNGLAPDDFGSTGQSGEGGEGNGLGTDIAPKGLDGTHGMREGEGGDRLA
jgi:hypothetical protein